MESKRAAFWNTYPTLRRMACSSSRLERKTDVPSMYTSPRSGTMRPMVVFRSTLFPVPEGPRIPRISPVSTVRVRPARTGTSNVLWMSRYSITPRAPRRSGSIEEEGREHRIRDENRDDHEHDGRRGGAPDAFRSAARQHPHVHGDERDDEAEGQRLHQR